MLSRKTTYVVLVFVVLGQSLGGAVSATPTIIEKFVPSPSGKYVAYVVKEVDEQKQRRYQVWLRTWGEKDRLLLNTEQLEAINSAYGSRVVALAWSPSERFLSIGVHDNDVDVITTVYDFQSNTNEILESGEDERGSWCSLWHPSKDFLFFRADDGASGFSILYEYDASNGTRRKRRIETRVLQYKSSMTGLVLRVEILDTEVPYKFHEELVFIPYSSFK